MGRLRVFARFQSKEEHEALVEGMLRARRLRQQIELYRTYRQLGVRTLEQARQYEANKRVRERDLKARKHRESAPYLFNSSNGNSQQQSQSELSDMGGGGGGKDGGTGGCITGRRRVRGNGEDSSTNLQDEACAEGANAGAGRGGGGGGRKSARSTSAGLDTLTTAAADSSSSSSSAAAAGASSSYYNSSSSSGGRGGGSSGSGSNDAEDPGVVARAPGGDLLSDLEIHFCAHLAMMPLHYLAAKDAVVR